MRDLLARSAVLALVALLALVGALTACPSGDEPALATPPYRSFAERPCPPDSALTWENFGQPYVTSWCTACHSSQLDEAHRAEAPVAINFDDLASVREHAGRMWARSGDQNNTMPPAGVAPAAERALFGEWLACGAPSRDDR